MNGKTAVQQNVSGSPFPDAFCWTFLSVFNSKEVKMEGKMRDETVILSEQERKIIRILRKMDYGEIRIIINGGKPTRMEEIKKSIML